MLRLAVRVQREQSELVLAELLELATSGVEEVDLGQRWVEYAVYGAPGELPSLPDLEAAAGGALVQVSTEEIAADWSERWRSFHRPLVIEGRLTVRPPWEPAGTTPIDVVIDPGQAFGTGAHATTRLCLELMLACTAAGSFVDVGCGSGVLAIVAAKLGYHPVTALDYDPVSVSTAADNARANDVKLEVRNFDLRTDQVPNASLVAANVLAPPLHTWAASQRTMPPTLILSGLLATEADGVSQAFAARGLRESERRTQGEWAALLMSDWQAVARPRGQLRREESCPPGRCLRRPAGASFPRRL
jgi:ribosomal protein L11 methyltransferase